MITAVLTVGVLTTAAITPEPRLAGSAVSPVLVARSIPVSHATPATVRDIATPNTLYGQLDPPVAQPGPDVQRSSHIWSDDLETARVPGFRPQPGLRRVSRARAARAPHVRDDTPVVSRTRGRGPMSRAELAPMPPSLVGPSDGLGGLLGASIAFFISDGDEPGENGGLLIGNGAAGAPGQKGGNGGLLFGNGGRGGDG
ncbi:hypothetical protein BST22_10165, partial [Mycolicibacterium chubuense]